MAVNMTITPGPDSLGPVGNTLSVYNKRAFSYTFTPTVPYSQLQTSGTASADFNTTTSIFANTTGYTPVGSTNTLLVDALSLNSTAVTPTFIAGSGIPGYSDGIASGASFNGSRGIVVDPSGNMYIADSNNFVIRKVTPSGVVTTLAGTPGVSGFVDGTGLSAQFGYPEKLTIDSGGNLYVTDLANYAVRKITPTGVVTTLAGNGTVGNQDGIGTGATLANPIDITTGSDGNIYLFDVLTSPLPITRYLRRITLSGVVTTLYTFTAPDNLFAIQGDSIGNILITAVIGGTLGLYRYSLSFNTLSFYLPISSQGRDILINQYGTIYYLFNDVLYKVVPGQPEVQYTLPNLNIVQLALYSSKFFGISPTDFTLNSYEIQVDVAPNRTRPSGYAIVATSGVLNVDVISRIVSLESPPIVNGTAQLYKYEPFSYQYGLPLSGDTFTLTTSPEVLAFTTSNSSNITFSSTSGYQASYTNSFPFTLQVSSNSVVQETKSFNVQVSSGRFFPPVSGSTYIVYRNELMTPIEFDTSASMNQVFSTPSLPTGLSLVQGDTSGNVWRIQGTPTLQTVATSYQIIGRNTFDGRVVSTPIALTVSGERLQLFVNGISNLSNQPIFISNMVDGNAIANQSVTAKFPGSPSFSYSWSPVLPNGILYTNVSSIPVSSPFIPSDVSRTIVLTGTPTLSALKSFAFANISNYTSTLKAVQSRPSGPISNTIPFTFSFAESVLFTADPYTRTQYVGVPLNVSNNVFFQARTYFGNDASITSIFSPDLRSDMSINFNFIQQKAYLVSATGTLTTSSNTFTLRAINTNGVTRDAPLTINSIFDNVSWNYAITPAFDTCYNFIYSRSLTDAKTGYYPSPIRFAATSAAGQPITYSLTGFTGTGIVISNDTLIGVPLPSPIVPGVQTAMITATAINTGVFNTTQIKYEILDDVITFTSALPSNFFQNIAITPTQVKTSTLSGRSITLYSGTNLPDGIGITPTGLMTGTPEGTTSGTYTITATTGYRTNSINQAYSLTPDAIAFIIDPFRYYIPPGSNIPSTIAYKLLSYSGIPVSNATINLGSNPTAFGVTITGNGVFGGTMTTCIPPDPIIPEEPVSVLFNVSATAGFATESSEYIVSSLNANGYYKYSTLQNSSSGNLLYYSVSLSTSDVPASLEISNYTNWKQTNLSLPIGVWGTSIVADLSTNSLVFLGNDVTTGYAYYSSDGVNFFSATTPSSSILVDAIRTSNAHYAVGVVSGVATLFKSVDLGASWSNLSTINDGSRTLNTRSGTANAYETYGLSISVNPSNGYIFVGGGDGGMITPNEGVNWFDTSILNGEIAGSYYKNLDLVVFGSDYYSTSSGVGTFIPSSTMIGSYNGSPGFPIPGQFNTFCYSLDVDPSGQVFLTTGIHYDGSGYIPQLRASSSLYGPYTVVDLSSNPLFVASPTPPKPPIGIGPVFFDSESIHILVSRGSIRELYVHDFTFPLTNWIIYPLTYENELLPEITTVSKNNVFVNNPNTLPYLDFTPGGDPNNPPAIPTFTAPVQREFIVYQYLTLDPILVTATGVGTVYLFADPYELPSGIQFNQLTGTISGIPRRLGPQTMFVYALDLTTRGIARLQLTFNVIAPRIIRRQDGAGAYTALLRTYTEVNAAQGARDHRVLPSEERSLGVFAAPNAPEVISAPQINPECCNPNK